MTPAMMMAEGPHGPNGEITGDPSNPIRMLFAGLISALIVYAGYRVYNSRY